MQIHNLIEYTDNYSKPSGSLSQYHTDDPDNNMAAFQSFKSKINITGKTLAAGIKIAVSLKYWSNFRTTLEMPLINREIDFILTWSTG